MAVIVKYIVVRNGEEKMTFATKKEADAHDKMLDIENWVPHDLRRTVRTGLSRLGCPSEVAEAILGHARKGIEGTYDLHKYENECKVWLQKWADYMDTLF